MRRLVVIPLLAALALSLGATSRGDPIPGYDPGTVSFTWDACDGPLKKSTSAPGIYTAIVSVLGTEILHKGYDLKFVYGDGSQTVPDAWRFDAAGCQGSTFISIDYLASKTIAKTCPSFMQDSPYPLSIKRAEFVPPFEPYASTLMWVELATSYPEGVQAVDPATRYFLGGLKFDHTYSVVGAGDPPNTCGGLETPMCFSLYEARVVDDTGLEYQFARDPYFPTLTFNDDSAVSCGAVPARATTWGQVKAQYR